MSELPRPMSRKEKFRAFRELMYDLEGYLADQAYEETWGGKYKDSKALSLSKRVSKMIVIVQQGMGLDFCDDL